MQLSFAFIAETKLIIDPEQLFNLGGKLCNLIVEDTKLTLLLTVSTDL